MYKFLYMPTGFDLKTACLVSELFLRFGQFVRGRTNLAGPAVRPVAMFNGALARSSSAALRGAHG